MLVTRFGCSLNRPERSGAAFVALAARRLFCPCGSGPHFSTGSVQAGGTSACYDADFLPFGKELTVTNTCPQNYKFEGKERDTETTNDDFGARYYAFRFGRWPSADWSSVPAPVPYANLSNPQTLNLYAMVSDNPESFADLDGHCTVDYDCRFIAYGLPNGELGPNGDNTTAGTTCGNNSASECPSETNTGTGSQQSQQTSVQQAQQQHQGIAASQEYATRDEAAAAAEVAALAATNKSGRKWEYGGLIIKNGKGKFTYTLATTSHNHDLVDVGSIIVPKGFRVVAEYHTHPHNFKAEGEGLSVGDENHSLGVRRTVYEADTLSRNMYRWTPGISKYQPDDSYLIGDFVTHIPQ